MENNAQLLAIAAGITHDLPEVNGNVLTVDFGNGEIVTTLNADGSVRQLFKDEGDLVVTYSCLLEYVAELFRGAKFSVTINDKGEITRVVTHW